MNYDVAGAVAATDFGNTRLWVGLTLAMLGYYGYYIVNIRAGFRDRSYGIPLVLNMFNFADDTTYVSLFGRWFHDPQYGFLLPKLMWFGIAAFVVLESLAHYQAIRFGLPEIFPGWSRRAALSGYLGLQVGVFLIWHLLWAMFGDPLFLMMFALTVVATAWFPLPMLVRRGSARGQSVAGAVLLMLPQLTYLCVAFPGMAPDFDVPVVYLTGVACFGAAATYAWRLSRIARSRPELSVPGSPVRI